MTNDSNPSPQTQGLSTADVVPATENPQPDTRAGKVAQQTGTQVETRSVDANQGPSAGSDQETAAPLFSQDHLDSFRSQWTSIQTGFVDNPRQSVEQADSLVANVIKQLAELFAEERQHMESQWEQGQDVSTEDLRVGLQRYRSFFDRLLSV